MSRRISYAARRYLLALVQGRVCPKCARPMFVAFGFKPPDECWRCRIRSGQNITLVRSPRR